MVWNAGDRQYELVEGWGTLPAGWTWGQVAGVACDSQDRVHIYTRTEHPYMVFDRSGNLVAREIAKQPDGPSGRTWGAQLADKCFNRVGR